MKKPISWWVLIILGVFFYTVAKMLGGMMGTFIGFLGFFCGLMGIVRLIEQTITKLLKKNK